MRILRRGCEGFAFFILSVSVAFFIRPAPVRLIFSGGGGATIRIINTIQPIRGRMDESGAVKRELYEIKKEMEVIGTLSIFLDIKRRMNYY